MLLNSKNSYNFHGIMYYVYKTKLFLFIFKINSTRSSMIIA